MIKINNTIKTSYYLRIGVVECLTPFSHIIKLLSPYLWFKTFTAPFNLRTLGEILS